MKALQYIYTSWKNGDSTEKGYMIYSRSEGITDSECSAIKDAMQYLAPKGLTLTPTPQEIEDIFPYAFAYFVLPTGRGCVAQSTYLGKDYSGRYGNYIIHALIFDIDDLPCRPAEFFAEPYIKTAMTQEELDAPSPVPPLPPLYISEYASVINDEQLNEFLFDKEDEFSQLISLVLAAQDAGVPFYLNDSRENLVLWSAAVQRILPSRLAKKFTFNTYIGNHESMRSPRSREENLNFMLIGVRPDANYFNYATESNSNCQIVMDFVGGYMTQGVLPGSFARAMAASLAFDCEEVDAFGEFVDSTSFNEISGHLQDAYLYYHLLKNDGFEFTENDLKAVLSFGSDYCSEADNSDIGSNLLIKSQENEWTLEPELFAVFWKFICRYSGFMIFTLYELLTETLFQHAGEASGPCIGLESLINTLKEETPEQYKGYLDYLNSSSSVEHLLLYLSGHNNPFTNSFYIKWLLRSYSFSGGMSNGQPISKLLQVLLKNVTRINGCEKQMMEILIATSDNQVLFKNIFGIFMIALRESKQLDRFCDEYLDAAASLTTGQLDRFEQLLPEAPGSEPVATRLFARKIAASDDPETEFWHFYGNQRSRISESSGVSADPMILACVNNVEAKKRTEVAVDILRKIDPSQINDRETIRTLTDAVEDCSVKELSKMEVSFLQKVCQIRAKVDKNGPEKITAVLVGEMLATDNAQRRRPVKLAGELAKTKITLQHLDKSDYESYLKNYFGEYFVLIKTKEDIPALVRIFYHGQYFSSFADDYMSALKKAEKREPEIRDRILGWTCTYVVTAERSDPGADDMYKPLVRYLRSLNEDELSGVRKFVTKDVPAARCDYLFDEARRKEGISEKLGNLFHKFK